MTNETLMEALETIAGGYTDRFPGAPDVMSETPETFRSKMWTWSQEVARAAIARATKDRCPKCGGSGAVDAPFSGSDPCCPDCGGSGLRETSADAYQKRKPGGLIMAHSPNYKIYRQGGEYVASCKYAEDAAAIVSIWGEGAFVKFQHRVRVWTEGKEDFSAGESYDRAASVMRRRLAKGGA